MASIGRLREAKSARGDASPKKRKLHHIEVHPARNGGHTVQYHYSSDGLGPGWHEPDVFAFGSGPETVSHLMGQLGVSKNELPSGTSGNEPESAGEEEVPARKSRSSRAAEGEN